MAAKGFRERLAERQNSAGTLLCVGLDPKRSKIPPHVRAQHTNDADAALAWMIGIVDATVQHASMFKPQFAHWLELGAIEQLRMLNQYITERYPEVPLITDAKVGDIAATQACYRGGHFEYLCTQGLNFNEYMGRDTLEYLIDRDHPERALVGLGRTSNSSAWAMQDRRLDTGLLVWQDNVLQMHQWFKELRVMENAGIVMGAAHKDPRDSSQIYSRHLQEARDYVGNDEWILIPGIGTQGGFIEETVKATYRGPGSVAINSGSAISEASYETDCFEAAAHVARDTKGKINHAVHHMGT